MEDNEVYNESRKWSKHNFRASTGEGMLVNLAMGLTTPFLGVIAIGLGGPNISVALLTALPCLINTIAYIPAAMLVEKKKSKLKTNAIFSFFTRIFYLLMAIVPFLNIENKATLYIALVSLQALPAVVMMVAWTSLVNNMFPQDERARIINTRSMYCSIVSLVGTFFAGRILDVFASPWRYFIIFFLSYLSTMCSIFFLLKQKEIVYDREPQPKMSLSERIKGPLTDPVNGKKFKRYLASAFVLNMGVYFAVPLFPIFHVRTLALSNSVIGSFNVLAGITAALSYSMWGKIIRRYGNPMVYVLSAIAFAIFPVTYYFGGISQGNNALILMILQFIIGIFNAGWSMSLFNLTLDYIDPTKAENGVAVFNTIINFSGVVAPLLCYFILTKWGVGIPFIVSSILRIIGCLIFIPTVDFKDMLGQMRRRRELNKRKRSLRKAMK